ncbi:MAG: NAD(P)H-hydrate dehydratase [Proteobacteria bacterium]|nr:NAD(P)H-hydrate dehydratase [Pseudomonadota bacterium]
MHFPTARDHKYTRGHAIVVGGPLVSTGAARMAAYAAMRAGAGLATILCDRMSLPVYAKNMLAVMTRVVENRKTLAGIAKSPKCHALLIGPGAGLTRHTKEFTLTLLKSGKPCVLDADALSVFEKTPDTLFRAIQQSEGEVVLTPHHAEFERLFGKISNEKTSAQQAAVKSGAVVVLKGGRTIIASPKGECRINHHASPDLATAGSGDVLAGIILGQLAQGMPAFDAASAAVWIHGDAGKKLGACMIAEDIIAELPHVMKQLRKRRGIK